MKNHSYLRHILNDNRSLGHYFHHGKKVTLDDLKRHILLIVRQKQYSVPDHYYRLGNDYSFDGISELSEVFTVGLPRLADEFLGIWDGKVYVKGNKFNEWQLLLPDIPPLILTVSKIWKDRGGAVDSIIDYAHDYIIPSVFYTALPIAYLPEMKVYEDEIQGFSDLHIHLNGAVETDLAWHDFLRFPEKVYSELKESYRNSKVKEQIAQMSDINDPIEFYNLFLIGGRIREWLFQRVRCGTDIFDSESFENLLVKFSDSNDDYKEHPFKYLLGENTSLLVLESMLYVTVLDYLERNKGDDVTAGVFHYYLLITGLCNRLLVQQTDAFGFEQFQKYTSNNFREFSEKTYAQRFFQLAGNQLTGFRHIEGRFSPKDSLEKNMELVWKIMNGFCSLRAMQKERDVRPSTLSLTAHFIKKPDKAKGDIRFRKLRIELKKKADSLIALKNAGAREGRLISGADAAASEFDTPPEVFAPAFRRLRKAGFEHFTYHAGEDFYHILSGLRAIFEAIIYLDLRQGDRIGHASASGVDVALWRSNIGEKVWMHSEDYLDDLVFTYFIITENKDKSLEHLLPLITLRCQELCTKIYGRPYSIHELIEAWKFRFIDPEDLPDTINKVSQEIINYRQSAVGRKKGGGIISVDTYDIFGEQELIHLQQLLLKDMHSRQIVIETLPTSNIIIGQHHDFKTYHLYNWYKWGKEGHQIPAIVVGCDDSGIFATNIYNEYCHIYCLLVFDKGQTSHAAMDFISHLVRNSKVYGFR